ncbi:MAG: hypothetical protein EOO48_00640 [Flavobacterium sp.]|nr:MAG: hypothetical protein EOO48_00640 [Flavobacterium sp.]
MYSRLFALKHSNHALWNGGYGGEMIRIFSDKQDQVISFSREKDGDKVIDIINYSPTPVTVKLNSKYQKGSYTELFTGKNYVLSGDDVYSLAPWQYLVLTQTKNGR